MESTMNDERPKIPFDIKKQFQSGKFIFKKLNLRDFDSSDDVFKDHSNVLEEGSQKL